MATKSLIRSKLGQVAKLLLRNDPKGLAALGVRKAAIAESPGGTVGGYLVPWELSRGIVNHVGQMSLFRRNGAYIHPMRTAEEGLPLPSTTQAPVAGTSPLWGGISFSFVPEAAARLETLEAAFQMVTLKASELSGYAVASNAWIQDTDAAAIGGWLHEFYARALAWTEDNFFLNGNGKGDPLGVLNAGGVVNITRGTANKFTQADAAAMLASLLPGSYAKAVWSLSPTAAGQLTSTGNFNNWVAAPPESDPSVLGLLLGRKAYVVEQLPALGMRGDVVLLDPSMYVIGDRTGLLFDVSGQTSTQFLKNQSVFRVTKRIDGRPMLAKPVTLQDATTQVAPFVVLN